MPKVSSTTAIVAVLIASLGVATLLAGQALMAARQRRAVSEAMLRQYAELATWEYSRQVRRRMDEAVMHTLGEYAHPQRERHADNESCNCETLSAVEHHFERSPEGVISSRGNALPDRLRDELSKAIPAGSPTGTENAVRILPLPGDATRFIAVKPEPHLPTGGHVGLVATVAALAPMLTRTYEQTALLPSVLARTLDPRALIDLRLALPDGEIVFSSAGTEPGPYVVESRLLPDSAIPLVAFASATPAFVASLGPEFGATLRTGFVMALVGINTLLVVVGLWQLARERELARLRADFVAGVSHELRTPLAQIRLFSETLLLDRVRSASERQRALEIIGQESQRLGQLVDNVLHFHRRSQTLTSSPSVTIDLGAFVRDVANSFEPLAAARRVQLDVSAPREEVAVAADPGSLRQVLLNLLDNAVKFGPQGQTVTIIVEARDGAATLSVTDQGSGVASGDRHRIFKAFERGRTTHATGGAGIGLAVVQQIVEAHRGRIACDSTTGGGARFVVTLPLTESSASG